MKPILTTFHLTKEEDDALKRLQTEKDMTKRQIIRQALRLYQLVHEHCKAGRRLYFEGDKKTEVIFL